MDPGNRKAVVAALVANAGIAIAKFVGYIFTGASSMLAEAVHSCADSGNQALLLWGGAAASRPATAQHPFGHGRERYFWAFIVSLVIFALGSVFAIYEGIHKLGSSDVIESPMIAISILLVGLVLEGLSFRTAVREARRKKGVTGWLRFVRQTRNPELPVVLLEDLGALIGLVIAMIGVSLAWVTGNPMFDALGSIVIGVLLGVIAALLCVEMKSLIIGESATEDQRRMLVEAAESAPYVRRLITMRTQHLGPDELLVGAKVEFDARLGFEDLTDAIDGVEASMRASVPHALIIYVEPDVYEAVRAVTESRPGRDGLEH
jgi:cation diffusion facilitator family transporter